MTQIKNRFTRAVIVEADVSLRELVVKSVKSNIALSSAVLSRAVLSGAALRGADLRGEIGRAHV